MSKYSYLSVKDIVKTDEYPFSLGQLRGYLRIRHHNGLDKAVRKIGKNLYLRRDLFEEWIESNQEDRMLYVDGTIDAPYLMWIKINDFEIERPIKFYDNIYWHKHHIKNNYIVLIIISSYIEKLMPKDIDPQTIIKLKFLCVDTGKKIAFDLSLKELNEKIHFLKEQMI